MQTLFSLLTSASSLIPVMQTNQQGTILFIVVMLLVILAYQKNKP